MAAADDAIEDSRTGSRPLVLISNDDGVAALGIQTLRSAILEFADVVIVAPEQDQSANSHSITLSRPLRHKQLEENVHVIDGTPADCIYLALYRERFLPRRPDIVLSGINHGLNLGSDVFYSGTVAAAREGALRGIPAIAFSMEPGGDFSRTPEFAASLVRRLHNHAMKNPAPVFLNVNFPAEPFRGVRVTRLGRRVYDESVMVRQDPRGREYFWIGGPGARHEPLEGGDTDAIDSGFISVTPLMLDLTYKDQMEVAHKIVSEP